MTTLSEVLQFIRPKAEFYITGDELVWVDEVQTEPTKAEIKSGYENYEAWLLEQNNAKTKAKSELLAKLGITEDEAKLLLS